MKYPKAVELLKTIITIPSFSRKEDLVADQIQRYFSLRDIQTYRRHNNVWVKSKFWDGEKPTLLLNSHIDTVKPNEGWNYDPFVPTLVDGKIIGLGSNDAGGPLVSLITAFMELHTLVLPFNLVMACTGEEEISGSNGIQSIVEEINPSFGIVGEPTSGDVAVAEKGLVVVDAYARGESGHAAREEGINAIYTALQDIQQIQNHPYADISPWLGALKMTVTQINAGHQHNVVPEQCHFVIDIRTTELYPNHALIEDLTDRLQSQIKARSLRLNPSFIQQDHVLVKAASELGFNFYGSPTLSDQALLSIPTIKLGPGDSARSHTADEFIYIDEIQKGIDQYLDLIRQCTKLLDV